MDCGIVSHLCFPWLFTGLILSLYNSKPLHTLICNCADFKLIFFFANLWTSAKSPNLSLLQTFVWRMVVNLSLGIVVEMLISSKVSHWILRVWHEKIGKFILLSAPEETGDSGEKPWAHTLACKRLQENAAGIYIDGVELMTICITLSWIQLIIWETEEKLTSEFKTSIIPS